MGCLLDKTCASFYPLTRSLDKTPLSFYPMAVPLEKNQPLFSPMTFPRIPIPPNYQIDFEIYQNKVFIGFRNNLFQHLELRIIMPNFCGFPKSPK